MNKVTNNTNYYYLLASLFFLVLYLLITICHPFKDTVVSNQYRTPIIHLQPAVTSSYLDYVNEEPRYSKINYSFTTGYFLNYLSEQISLANTDNKLPQMNQIVAELDQWSGNLQFNHNFSIGQLTDWWNKNKPRSWQLYKYGDLYSWEAYLARYDCLAQRQLEIIDKQAANRDINLLIYRGYLYNQNKKISNAIYRLKRNVKDKDVLNNLYSQLFTKLIKQINKTVPDYDSNKISYSLTNALAEKDYGIYNIYINYPNLPPSIREKVSLQINNQVLTENNIKDKNVLTFKDVIIDKKTPLHLTFADINLPIKNSPWYKDQDDNGYIYSLNIPKVKEKLSYILNFTYQVDKEIILYVEEINTKTDPMTDSVQRAKRLLPDNKLRLFQYQLTFNPDNAIKYRLSLIAKNAISDDVFEKISIYYQPIFEPELTLEKVKPLIGQTNKTSPIVKASFGLNTLFACLSLIPMSIFLLLYLLSTICTKINSRLPKIVHKILPTLHKLRFYLLLIFLISLTMTFISDTADEKLYLLVFLSWMATALGYNTDASISSISAAFFLLATIGLYLVNFDNLAEKMSILIYLFFLASAGQLYSQMYFKLGNLVSFKQFIRSLYQTNSLSRLILSPLKHLKTSYFDAHTNEFS